ncbi:hypothetical protein [Micromonospora schwarzwaldensis]|uniref:hypothetical protein n=1 Tax=Micromonospora sp. DSM 45708 TaxID=3111767 RepID=UPI0031D26796
MEHPPDLDTRISAAVARLQAGDAPGQAFGRLATTGGDLRLTAIAVCVAGGTSVSEADQRLLEYLGLFDEVPPDEEGVIGEVLESAGYFDHQIKLDEASTEIAKTLREALKAAGPIPSGWALTFHRSMTTGKMLQAFLSAEALWCRRTPANAQVFWTHMADAARLLGDSAEPGFTEAARRCRGRLHD